MGMQWEVLLTAWMGYGGNHRSFGEEVVDDEFIILSAKKGLVAPTLKVKNI